MLESLILLLCLALLIKPTGHYLHMVYNGDLARRYSMVHQLEHLMGKCCGIDFSLSMKWRQYTLSILAYMLLCFAFVFALLLMQTDAKLPSISPTLAFNITVSFLTGTNLQTYIPEATLNVISQNFGLTFLQFMAPAIDMAIAVALFRAFASTSDTIGNFWQDFIRGVVFILLPMALLVGIFNVSQGVVQSLEVISVQTLAGEAQTIQTGFAASMRAISQLATNGGGYFAVNAAHPFANPTPLSNFINTLLIMLLPAAFVYLLGLKVADKRQSLTLLALIGVCVICLTGFTVSQESNVPAELVTYYSDSDVGNMEGKELRIGSTNSAIWGSLTTATASGSTNAALESFAPLSILTMTLQMLFGEILLGGVGIGMINLLAVIIVTVFLSSLMIGRSPEYLRKQLGVAEIQLAVIIIVIPALFLLMAISLAVSLPESTEHMQFDSIYGYTESLYAIISAAFNNGSTLGGIELNNSFYNILLASGMLFSGILPKILGCVLAGNIAKKSLVATNSHSLQTHGVLFAMLLLLMIIISALSYVPVLLLGPISIHMQGIG